MSIGSNFICKILSALSRKGQPSYSISERINQDGFLYNLQQEDDGKTPVQRIMSEDGIPTVRGRILGGTSMINAGVHAGANISFYNESGIEWDMDLVNKTYKWLAICCAKSIFGGWWI